MLRERCVGACVWFGKLGDFVLKITHFLRQSGSDPHFFPAGAKKGEQNLSSYLGNPLHCDGCPRLKRRFSWLRRTERASADLRIEKLKNPS
jgi:hypothetical protein